MPISVTRLPHEPIVIVKYENPIANVAEETRRALQQVADLTKDVEDTIYRINDVLSFSLNFGDMVVGMAEETRSKLPGSLGDPRVRSVTVGSAELVKFGTEAASQEQYGQIDIKLFTAINEALAYAREQIRSGKQANAPQQAAEHGGE